MVTPRALRSCTTLNSTRRSASDRLEVGSSRISRRGSCTSDLQISMSCCCAMVRSPSRVSGSSAMPSRPIAARALRAEACRGRPARRAARGSTPRKMFSAIVMFGASISSWNTIEMPWCGGVLACPEVQFLAVEDQAPGGRRVGAGDDLHQRRLAGAVLAHDGVDRAGLDLEGHVLQRLHARIGLGDRARR